MTARLRVWTLVWLVAPAVMAAPPAGPGRIGVFGSTTVVSDCLARYGLPRTVIAREQILRPGGLAGFDAVCITGAALLPATCDALDRYLEGGGRLLVDVSSIPSLRMGLAGPGEPVPGLPGGGVWRPMNPAGNQMPQGPQVGPFSVIQGISRSAVRPTAGSPLAALGELRFPYICAVPDVSLLTNPVVLAEYAATSPVQLGRPVPLILGAEVQAGNVDKGPAGPAIVMGQRKGGTLLLCGVPAGTISTTGRYDTDGVLLAILSALTNGRLRPQIEPEVPKLGGKQAAGTLPGATAADEPPAADRPDGPGPRAALPADAAPLADNQPDEYNLTTTLPAQRGELLLNWWNAANYLRVAVSPSAVDVTRVAEGREQPLAHRTWTGAAQAPLSIKERSDALLLTSGAAVAAIDLGVRHRGALGARGFGARPQFANAESVAFSDDFMRTNEHAGGWETEGGTWETAPVQNPELGANPFSFKVNASGKTAAATTGSTSWDEYRFTSAVRPGTTDGHVGLHWYQTDRDNYYAFRAATQADGGATPGGLALIRRAGGVDTVLATAAGSLMTGQWYSVAVQSCGPQLTVLVDGRQVLAANDTQFTHGRIGLVAESCQARFDDVDVRCCLLAPTEGSQLSSRVPRYAGRSDVASWAGPVAMWEADPDTYGLFWQREPLWGDQSLSYTPGVLPDGASATLLLDAAGGRADAGLALTVQRRGTQATLELRRHGVVGGRTTLPATAAHALSLERRDGTVRALLDGQAVAQVPAGELPHGRVGFRAEGYRPKLSGLTVWGRYLRDDAFDTAPTNWWVASGTWDLTNRWTCTPDWSWFGGMSEGEAAIWHKQPVGGDMVLEYYCAPRMMGGPDNVRANGLPNQGAFQLQIDGVPVDVDAAAILARPELHLQIAGADAQRQVLQELVQAEQREVLAQVAQAPAAGPAAPAAPPAPAGANVRPPLPARPPGAGPGGPTAPGGAAVAPRQPAVVRAGASERCGDLNAVICGDGASVMSGYSALVGSLPAGGAAQRGPQRPLGACILRRGQPVATDPSFVVTGNIHNNWVDVRLERHGATVSLAVDGRLVLSYDDPDPLPGGYAGIWTQRNGIMVPRVTLSAEKLLPGWLSHR